MLYTLLCEDKSKAVCVCVWQCTAEYLAVAATRTAGRCGVCAPRSRSARGRRRTAARPPPPPDPRPPRPPPRCAPRYAPPPSLLHPPRPLRNQFHFISACPRCLADAVAKYQTYGTKSCYLTGTCVTQYGEHS